MKDIDNYLDLVIYRNKIIECYYNIYNKYKILSPLSLDSKDDITLDFVNCTICIAKTNISNDLVGENYVLAQPCLRNNHIDVLKDKDKKTNYMGYFTMLGGYCYIKENESWIDKFNEIIINQFSFFRTLYPDNYIKLTIPQQYKKYLPLLEKTKKTLENNNCEIIYSIIDEENLRWKYGIENVKGYGTRWEILGKNNRYVNCGNDIVLFKNNKAIGIDFGSGLESIVSVVIENEHLLYANVVCSDLIKKFCEYNNYNEKLIDCLTSLLCIDFYKAYYNFRIKYLRYMYIKIISAICIINDLSSDDIKIIINDLCNSIGLKNDEKNLEIIKMIEEQKQFLNNLISSNYIEKIIDMYNNSKYNYRLRGYKKNISHI